MAKLPNGWTEASANGLACSNDPHLGGIIDCTIATKEWFVIFNSDKIESIGGLPSRDAAFEAYDAAINETFWLV